MPASLEAVARALGSSGGWFWFDGEAAAAGEARISTLGTASEVRYAERGREREFLAGLRRGLGGDAGERGARGRFSGGWVVALGYEFGVGLLGLDPAPDAAPPAFALRVDTLLVVDHDAGTAEVRGADPEGWIARHLERVVPDEGDAPDRVRACRPDPGASPERRPAARRPRAAGWRRSNASYLAAVDACRAAIHDGDAYVLCLTDTAEARVAVDPLELYGRLRERGPAIRGGIVVAGDRALVSASPERFLGVRGASLVTHPIKGTRPRGWDDDADRRLADELAADRKEQAENLMIVDLMRNDLSRVCAPGSVRVPRFLDVETHPHVHQLVSTIEGRLAGGRDALDAIEACFPGGSMTGAPKRSAARILARAEGGARGLYAGCFGWIDRSGDAELAMTIRSVELRGIGSSAPVALVGSGGGITADSDPERELREKDLKAGPLLSALNG